MAETLRLIEHSTEGNGHILHILHILASKLTANAKHKRKLANERAL